MLYKCSFLLFLISCIVSIRQDSDEEYGEQLEAVAEAYKKSNNLYKEKPVNYFSKIYEKPKLLDIVMNTANIVKGDESSTKSFKKLNAIANNLKDGDLLLKANPMLKGALGVILQNNKEKPINRVNAAKLATRLENIPVSIQMVSDSPSKKPTNFDSYVVVPRTKRIYRPDYYIENYKAGNWAS